MKKILLSTFAVVLLMFAVFMIAVFMIASGISPPEYALTEDYEISQHVPAAGTVNSDIHAPGVACNDCIFIQEYSDTDINILEDGIYFYKMTEYALSGQLMERSQVQDESDNRIKVANHALVSLSPSEIRVFNDRTVILSVI